MDRRWLLAAPAALLFILAAALVLWTRPDGSVNDPSAAPRTSIPAPQIENPVPQPNTTPVNLAAGRAVVVGASPGIAANASCQRCHGVDGVGDGAGAFPKLTGQAEWYLYKQLKDYAVGMRPNDIMTPIARQMSDTQMQAVARWYNTQEPESRYRRPDFSPLVLQQGGALAAIGNPDNGVAACADCHGARGEGVPPTAPSLAGQYAPYIQLQLDLWKQGVRANDAANVMREIAVQLTEEEARAVALYYESVPPSGPKLSGWP